MNASPESRNGDIVVHVFAKTDVGRTREHNEDSFAVADLTTMNTSLAPNLRVHTPGERGSLFMVADGMGGAAAGEIASAMATEVVLRELEGRWRHAADTDSETFARALKTAAEVANARIHRYATEHPENRGMGTTATIAGFLGDTLYLVQVGDSRAYIIRDGVAQQITKDQSLMQKLVEAGELTAEEAEVSERRNIILQALGPEPVVKVDLTHQKIRRGDTLVLCSDGLSGQMRADDIARIMTETPDLQAACKQLIDLANENGGPDNITVVAVHFDGEGLSVAGNGDGVGHQVYASESDRRVTVPVEASAVTVMELEDDSGRAATAEGAQHAATMKAAFAEAARQAAAHESPPPSPVDLRVSDRTLRLVFGAIGVLVAGVVLYRVFRDK